MEGGKDIDVTNENKYEYVQRMAYQKLYNSIKKQVDAFLQGFYDIVPKQLVQIFDNRELELLISGLPNIDSKIYIFIIAQLLFSNGPQREHRVPELHNGNPSSKVALRGLGRV